MTSWTQVLWRHSFFLFILVFPLHPGLSLLMCSFSWNLHFVDAESLTLLFHSLLNTEASGSPWIPVYQKAKMEQPIWDVRYHRNVRVLLLWAQATAELPDQRRMVKMCSAGKGMVFHAKQNTKSLCIDKQLLRTLFFREDSVGGNLNPFQVCVNEWVTFKNVNWY